MSSTPRTDLNCITVETLRTMKGTGTKIVLAAVCGQLERELAAALAHINRLESGIERLRHEHDPFEQERIYKETMEVKP